MLDISFVCLKFFQEALAPASRGVARLTLMVEHTFYNTTYLLLYLYGMHAGSNVHLFMDVLKSTKYE